MVRLSCWLVLILAALLAMCPVVVAWAEDEAPAAESAEAEPASAFDDWYGQLSLRSGGLFSFETEEFTPYLTVPILGYRKVTLEGGAEIDVDEKTEAHGPVAGVLGLTYDLGNLRDMGIEVSWADYFGVNVGPYLRYDFAERDVSFGFMASIVDLSFDQGNVERQKTANR